MKLVVKDPQKAKEALRSNREFHKGQVLSGDAIKMQYVKASCPEAFESDKEEVKEVVKSEHMPKKNKLLKKNKKFKSKSKRLF